MNQTQRRDVGAIVFGVILLLVGGYYLLQQTLGVDLPTLDWSRIWPVFLLVLGGVIVYRSWQEKQQG